MRKFWNYVNDCQMKIKRGSRIVLIGDLNGRLDIKRKLAWFQSAAWME